MSWLLRDKSLPCWHRHADSPSMFASGRKELPHPCYFYVMLLARTGTVQRTCAVQVVASIRTPITVIEHND